MLAKRLAEANTKHFLPRMWSFGNGRTLHTVAFDRNEPKAIEECTGLLNLEFMQQPLAANPSLIGDASCVKVAN